MPAIDSTAIDSTAIDSTAIDGTAKRTRAAARAALARPVPARAALARAALAAALAVLAAGCSGGSGGQAAGTQPGASAAHATKAPSPAAHPASPAATGRRPRAAPTLLPVPLVTGRPALGLPAFFPLSAYRQVKAIADPTADWHHRLVADFRLDVRAARALLGRRARHARLVRLIVPSAQASWITPGVCANGVGYWHVAGARGRWYVVHFGAVLRSASVGIVDQPASGAGTPGPPGGC